MWCFSLWISRSQRQNNVRLRDNCLCASCLFIRFFVRLLWIGIKYEEGQNHFGVIAVITMHFLGFIWIACQNCCIIRYFLSLLIAATIVRLLSSASLKIELILFLEETKDQIKWPQTSVRGRGSGESTHTQREWERALCLGPREWPSSVREYA